MARRPREARQSVRQVFLPQTHDPYPSQFTKPTTEVIARANSLFSISDLLSRDLTVVNCELRAKLKSRRDDQIVAQGQRGTSATLGQRAQKNIPLSTRLPRHSPEQRREHEREEAHSVRQPNNSPTRPGLTSPNGTTPAAKPAKSSTNSFPSSRKPTTRFLGRPLLGGEGQGEGGSYHKFNPSPPIKNLTVRRHTRSTPRCWWCA